MSNGRFSHNLNMEIVGPLLAQIGKSILVVSHLFSTSTVLLVQHQTRSLQVSTNNKYLSYIVY